MQRVLFRRAWVWAPLGALILLGVSIGLSLRVGDLEDALVREANEIVAAPRTRPVHVDAPLPGTFGDALRAPLRRYERAWERLVVDDDERALVAAVAKGERPTSDLPARMTAGLSQLDTELDAVLMASRAERADLGPDHDPFGPFKGTSWLGLQYAARHAAIRIRSTASCKPARALSSCLDGLALGRDAAFSGGLVGRMIRGAVVGLLVPACAEAISASGPKEALAVAQRLRLIRDATPSFGAMLREEGIQVQLLAFGPGLPAAAKEQLLPRPRAFADDGSMGVTGVLGSLRSRLAWREFRRLQARLAAIGEFPAPERDAAFAAPAPSSLLVRFLLGGLDGPDLTDSYARYSRLDVAAGLRLDLLILAAATLDFEGRRSRWPSSIAELAAEGLLDGDEANRLARAAFDEQRDRGGLDLVLPVPQPDAGTTGEAVVRVSRSPALGGASPRAD